jgi:hypothetical protein
VHFSKVILGFCQLAQTASNVATRPSLPTNASTTSAVTVNPTSILICDASDVERHNHHEQSHQSNSPFEQPDKPRAESIYALFVMDLHLDIRV